VAKDYVCGFFCCYVPLIELAPLGEILVTVLGLVGGSPWPSGPSSTPRRLAVEKRSRRLRANTRGRRRMGTDKGGTGRSSSRLARQPDS
jgi:hypothetical protein